MVKIDFNRAGLDSGWTVTGKDARDYSMALVPSGGKSLRLEDPITSFYIINVWLPSHYAHSHPRVLHYWTPGNTYGPLAKLTPVRCASPPLITYVALRCANTNHVSPQDNFVNLAVHASVSKNKANRMILDAPDVNEFPKQDEGKHGKDNVAMEQGSSIDISTVLIKEEEQEDQQVQDSAKAVVEQPAQAKKDEQDEKDSLPQRPPRNWSCLQFLDGLGDIFSLTNRRLDAGLQQALVESASLYKKKKASAAEARERLQRVMHLYNMKRRPVEADGNCQFRALALSQQINGIEDNHVSIRARIVEHLRQEPERYKDFVYEEYSDYLKRMAKDGQWGDHVTLQAASDVLGKDIRILTDQPGAECVDVRPQMASNLTEKPLCLTFLTEIHYDAAEPCEEI